MRRRNLIAALTAAAAVCATLLLVSAPGGTPTVAAARRASTTKTATASTFQLPPVRHVFVIMLENENLASTFGDPSADPYFASTLPSEGAFLGDYYATGPESNDNCISIVSGQPPNPENQADCQFFDDFSGADLESNGVESGMGCVYPSAVQNIGTQLSAAGLSWKAYGEDMGNDPNRETAACGHPTLNSQDQTEDAVAGDGYATRHDPFVYFHSVIDNQTYCDDRVRRPRLARLRDAGRGAGRRDRPGHRSEEGLDHAELLVHHAEPVRRRPRLSVYEPGERCVGARRHRRIFL